MPTLGTGIVAFHGSDREPARNTSHTHTQTGQPKHGLAQDNKNLAGESTPLLDGLTSSPELLVLEILRNWKTFAGNSCLAVPGSFEVFVYGNTRNRIMAKVTAEPGTNWATTSLNWLRNN